MSQIMDVIVVGCGASGIAAMSRLKKSGLKVLGLEAAARIGGRICTVPYGENVLDLGAAWCHGEVNNKVYELANPHKLLGNSTPAFDYYVQSHGELVPNGVAGEIVCALEGILEKADKDNCLSIRECLRNGVNSTKLLDKPSLANSFLEWFERNNHIGGQNNPLAGKSMRGLQENKSCEGDFLLHWKGRGYNTILDVLMEKIPNPYKMLDLQILINKEVETIKWDATQPGMTRDVPLVHVRCKDGSLYAAKRVIVTVSIGVLKERHHQLFNPPLTTEKVNSINNLQLCVLDKIYIQFEKPWWPKTPANFTILWRQEDKDKFSLEEKWLTEIHGFMTIENQPNILLAWIYGEGAKSMEEISLENVQIGIEKLLNILFRKFRLSPVKSILRSQWASNALIRGAYSYRSVATEQNGGDAATLSQPLSRHDGVPVVCFAGEATSISYYGAVHGAVEAGFREADRIISSF